MLPEQQQRILGYFIEEAKDHLNTIEQGLLNLQSTIDDPEMLREVYRAAHSVKGGAGMLGLNSIQKTSHLLEDCFKILEGQPIRVDQKLEALFLRVFDTLQSLLEQLQGPFGLTEDVAASLMSAVEPVFTELEQHLEVLVHQPAGGKPTPTPAAERAKQSQMAVFKQDVVNQLREMLQLFKPPHWPSSREQLLSGCDQLQQLGARFNLPAWSSLIEMASAAIAYEENSAQALAPVIIKEIKQAQDLVLAGRDAEISVSEQLLALQPPAPVAAAVESDELEELLSITDDADSDWLFGTDDSSSSDEFAANDSFEDTFSLSPFDLEPEPDSTVFWDTDLDATPAPTTARAEVPPTSTQPAKSHELSGVTPADPTGPEVGVAELNTLADLFEFEDAQELDSKWQVEEVVSDASNESLLESVENFGRDENEFADLFEDSSAATQVTETSEDDDTLTLFGQSFLDEDSTEEPSVTSTQDAADDEFGDLFEDDFSASAAETPSEAENLSLFGENFFNDDSELETAGTSSSSPAPTSQPEADDLSELFAGLNEDDLTWEQAVSEESESPIATLAEQPDSFSAAELGTEQQDTAASFADLASASDSSWLEEDWMSEDTSPEVPEDFELAGFESNGFGELPDELAAEPDNNLSEDWAIALESPQEEAIADEQGLWGDTFDDEVEQIPTGSTAELLNQAQDEEIASLFGDEPDWVELEDIPQDWTAETTPEEEAPELGALGDFDFDANSFFTEEVAATDTDIATTPQEEAPELGALGDFDFDANSFFTEEVAATDTELAQDNGLSFAESDQELDAALTTASDSSFDDFFSFDGGINIGGNQSETQAEFSLDDSLLDTSEDLFGEMESPAPADISLGLEENAQTLDFTLEQDGSVDLFAEESEPLDLFGSETAVESDAFEIAQDSTSEELFSLAAEETEDDDGADEAFDWLSEITSEAGSEPFDDSTDGNGEFSLEPLDLEETSAATEFDGDDDFAALEALLDEEIPEPAIDGQRGLAQMATAPTTESSDFDFDALEAMLGDDLLETPSVIIPVAPQPVTPAPTNASAKSTPAKAPTASTTTQKAKPVDNDFADLEGMLDEDFKVSGPPAKSRPGQVTPIKRPRIFEQTMKVPVKHLDNLTNLVGELVVNRNSLEGDQERLRQFLDNLLHQVQQLSDVGARMQDLYERSLLESALLASRQSYRFSSASDNSSSNGYSSSSGTAWDHIEMDRFTPFHTLSQEMIELIVRVRESASDIEFIVDETEQVTRQFRQVSTQLQEGLTRARMVPFAEIERVFPLFRYVRDKAAELGKQAELRIEGRETLIDKLILEHLSDPLKHLINNALAHGIESPEIRQAAGKPPIGRITLSAFHQGNQTVISFGDDGGGIDVERVKAKAVEKGLIRRDQAKALSRIDAYELLYHPGLSTKDEADLLAGKGVGMDVVRTNVSEIRGTITTDSTQGKGTTFTIRLPLTLSICKALSCVSDKAMIAFPMDGVEDALDVPKDRVQVNAEGSQCIPWRDTQLPFRPLSELLTFNRHIGRGSVYGANKEEDAISVVVMRSAGNLLAVQVDQVIGEQEIVIKQLEGPVPKPVGIAGATVLGDGRIMAIADVLELIDLAMGRLRKDHSGMLWEQNNLPLVTEAPVTEPRVLIVDDSITVRELLSMTFNKAGYRVEQARDGQEAWDKLKSGLPCDIVFCDIEMPRMDGLELLSRLHKDPELTHLPVAMLTSRGAQKHQQMAFDLGASGYFTKPYLEEALLDAASRMLKGERLVTSNISSS